MEEVEGREWYLAAYAAEGVPTSDHLKLRTVTLSLSPDSIPEQHVILETLFISVEPYLRSRITGREDGLYSPQFNLDEVIAGFGVGKVIRSKDGNYVEGDIVVNPFTPFAEYCVVPSQFISRRIDPNNGIPLPEYISSLGVPGFAAWVGIELLADPKPGSNVFISAAAGAVGMYAGQLAKLRGCRVIGSTGSDEKVKLIKEEFGYDDAFNYHTETDFDAALSKYFPNGIDVYLDNVGGEMLEAALNHVNKHAKVPLCGMISDYNKVWTERKGVRNLLNLIGKEVNMQGFMVGSYLHRIGDFATEMESHLKQEFHNVGGEMLEAALNHVNKHAKIPLCGMISGYNKVWTEREGVRNLLNLIGKEVNMQGFLVGSYLHRYGDFATEMESIVKQGKIGYSKLKIFHYWRA